MTRIGIILDAGSTPPSPPPIYYVSIEDDRSELSEFQKSLKYKIVKVGDIVKEVHWISAEPMIYL